MMIRRQIAAALTGILVGNTVLFAQAAWDETVTTGYKCSGCGATK